MTLLRNPFSTTERQLRHLSKAVQIEETLNPRINRGIMLVLSFCVFGFLGWASVARLTELARTVGTIEPHGMERDIQHLEGGLTSEIFVEDGQVVEEGDVLITLDGADIKGDLSRAKDRMWSLRVQQIRLAAYLANSDPDFSALVPNIHPRIENAKAANEALRRALNDKIEVSKQQIWQKEEDIEILSQRLKQNRKNASFVEDRLRRHRALFEKGHVAQLVVSDTEASLEDLNNETDILTRQLKGSQRTVNEFQSRLRALVSEDQANAHEQLAGIEAQISETREMISKMSSKVERLRLRAPVTGVVKGISSISIGSLIRPATSITKIVPTEGSLIARIQIAPKDIGRVAIGVPVRLKLSAFEFDRYGYTEGVLTKISAATFASSAGTSYYSGEVTLSRSYVGDDPARNRLIPGMAVSADIVTGYKTVLEYLLQPIRSALSVALSEA